MLIEQLRKLLDRINFKVTSDLQDNFNFDRTPYTPIETILKDHFENSGINYRSQVGIGNYYADFVVNVNNHKVVIECDGRDYHDAEHDSIRDNHLRNLGYETIRFSGSEIYNNPQECINRILIHNPTTIRIDLDNELDESQSAAINEIYGPIRVLAPAGSGKTKTLINRIMQLLNNGIDPNNILALAFNKKASEVMKDRLTDRGVSVSNRLKDPGVAVRTFHSFGNELIQDYFHWRFDAERHIQRTRELLGEAYRPFMNIPGYLYKDAIDKLMEALCRVRMELLPLNLVNIEVENNVFPFREIYERYQGLQTLHQVYNFDDMIYLALRILINEEHAREELQKRFQFILVDEFQDLNDAQLLMMQILALPMNNLFIVGDDDQMIYGWRGATIKNILDFPQKYINAHDFILSTNYRSSKKIVTHSKWLIKHNQNRVNKDIKAKETAESGILDISLNENLIEQANRAKEWILSKKDQLHLSWKDFAILFRYHEYQYPIAMVLDAFEIPHNPVNDTKLFKTNPGRDIYAYLTIILHPDDAKPGDYSRALKRPNKYINNEIVNRAIDWNSFLTLDEDVQEEWKRRKIREFIDEIVNIKDRTEHEIINPYQLVSEIITRFEFVRFYQNEVVILNDIDKAGDETLLEVLLSVAKMFESIDEFYMKIHQAITETEHLVEQPQEQNQDEILLSSIHASKGKEFQNVIYFNLSMNGNFQTSDIEEERRVCYVGITRAIKNILITGPTSNYSTFLKEILLNPEFSQLKNEDLNKNKTLHLNEIRTIESRIKFLQAEIEKIQVEHPELAGENLRINFEQQASIYKQQIASIKNKYPEIEGAALVINFVFFKNYFIELRINKIEKAMKKIHLIEQKISDIHESLIAKRQREVENATALVQNKEGEINSISLHIRELNEINEMIDLEIQNRTLLN